jgi:hypothetical protein
MEGKIKLLNPELTGDCSSLILNEIRCINKLKDEMSDLFEKKLKIEKEYNERNNKLRSLVGVVFDFIEDDKTIDYTVNKTNIVFNNVNGGSKR